MPSVARFAEALFGKVTPPLRAWLLHDGLAEEIVFLDCGERVVNIRAADEAKLERIHAELRIEFEPAHEASAEVHRGTHLRRLGFVFEREVAVFPARDTHVAGEFIIGRKRWMRLAVAFRLHDFLNHLPPRSALGVIQIGRASCRDRV